MTQKNGKIKYRQVLDTLRNIKPEDNIKHNTISKVLGGTPTAVALLRAGNKKTARLRPYYGTRRKGPEVFKAPEKSSLQKRNQNFYNETRAFN